MVIKEDFYVMSDGVILYTRAVLPESEKKFPIVFIRTPYEPDRNGVSYNLTEEITSLAYIDRDYTPCNECEISIDTPPIAFTLKKGCRIRVDISSHSNLYVPHSNTKEHWAKAIETKTAQNTLICDKSAYILLPLLRVL